MPFTRGGAELLSETLVRELKDRGYDVDTVALPFSAQPIESLLKQVTLWRSLDLSTFAGRSVDLVIGTKFPTYAVRHPRKSVWLVHQHRQLYDLYGSRFGDFSTSDTHEALRRMLMNADRAALEECQSVCTISPNVTDRLLRFSGVGSTVLMPPLPCGNRYKAGAKGRYLLSVGRLCSIKRTDLIIKAMPLIAEEVQLKIVGQADEPDYGEYLQSEIRKHGLSHRVEMLGRVDENRLLELFADALAVCYTPYDEDYGFVTLEAFASGKPVLTTNDSGGVLSFVEHERNGLAVEPTENALAAAANRLFTDSALYDRLATAAGASGEGPATWDRVIEELTAPLHAAARPVDSAADRPNLSKLENQ